ncbi:hypothetical protein THRCLA_20273 [Thraustotheca clavata]|uniref:HSF-type DNA-binding domain-containing protein n=1 Tax=Thraustotheca clavata TaxID=74557 RepID=A0A1W0A9E2_9STRA|nr:hypothetical protein THRCLA_20273 [Thraustotheca clavata]
MNNMHGLIPSGKHSHMNILQECEERPQAMTIPSTFLRNLYGFLNNNNLPDTIAWDADGRSFSILDPEKMENSLPMPNLYRGRFKTFKMQLEKHGFMKSPDGTRYFRPDFVKGRPQQLGDANLSPRAAMDNGEKRMSLECRIQVPKAHEAALLMPKKRRIHEEPSDVSAAALSSSCGSWKVSTKSLLCSVNIAKPKREIHEASSVIASSAHSLLSDRNTSVPSLRPSESHQCSLPRLPSLSRAFPLFGLQSRRPGDT